MNLLQHRYRSWIVPYVEGTLDARRRAKLEARLAHDPALAAEAEAERRVVARLREAAQGGGGAAGEAVNLWPGIQSRLEPRRSSLRPLILVGGLSAAATSLIWAAVWGPLGYSAPASHPALVANDVPSVIVIGPLTRHRHPHFIHRPRVAASRLAKRSPALRPLPRLPVDAGQSGTQTNDLLTASGAPPVASEGTNDTPAPLSAAGSGGGAHFRLAARVRPVGEGSLGSTPTDSANVPASGAANATDKSGVDSGGASPGNGSNATTGTTPTADTTRLAAEPPSAQRRHRRHHRRHYHTRRSASAATSVSIGTTPAGMDAPPQTSGASVRPKAGSKPVD